MSISFNTKTAAPPAATTRAGTSRARFLLAAAGLGLLAGLLWGVAARAWMRTISENPEFS